MLLSSLHFIFIFLPIAFILYSVLPFSWWRNFILITSSLIFYTWGEPVYVFLLLLLILFNWLAGLIIRICLQNERASSARFFTITGVIINLLPLIFFKLNTAMSANLLEAIGLGIIPEDSIFPLGLSFYTFSAVAYIVDVYREKINADKNILHVGNFLSMFPKMLQGPITRYSEVQESLQSPKIHIDEIAGGLRRFIIGLAKKVLIADYLGNVTSQVFGLGGTSLSAGLAWYGLIAFSLQLYLDFSGYTDMAIGLGRMLGFKLSENFNFPYISRSVTDFWRRWHMSLVNWLRAYIFMPLEIARRREKHFRLQSNIMIIFLITGLWHGFTWNFIIWGLYFGVILSVEASFLSKWLKKIPAVFQHMYSLLLISIGWVFFQLENPSWWPSYFRALFGFNKPIVYTTLRSLNILVYIPLLILGAIISTPLLKNIYDRAKINKGAQILADILLIGLFIICISILISGNYQAFLYSEF